MNWKEMTDEILMDIGRISAVSLSFGNPARHIVGMVQWNGKTLARLVLQPSPFQIVGDGGITAGMSMIPEPPADWRPADIGWAPSTGGVRTKGNMPLAYYVDGENGSGVAFASRFGDGKINWIHSEEHIDLVRDRLLVAGIWKLTPTKETE